jgi:hypothetical protein
MITAWKICGINDSWWITTFRKTGSISRTIQQQMTQEDIEAAQDVDEGFWD